MNSGIYLLKFQTGDTYIGQAKDFNTRWARHDREMLQGKHTKLVQDAYNRSGCVLPSKHKILICHPDWLDYYEALLILQEAPPLNTQSPRPMSESTKRALVALHERGDAVVGILDSLGELEKLQEICTDLRSELEALQARDEEAQQRLWEAAASGAVEERIEELTGELEMYQEWNSGMEQELQQLRAFRAAVERTGLIGRLLKAWG